VENDEIELGTFPGITQPNIVSSPKRVPHKFGRTNPYRINWIKSAPMSTSMCALFEKDWSANWIFGRSLNASDGTSRDGRFSAKMEEDWRKFVLECEDDARSAN